MVVIHQFFPLFILLHGGHDMSEKNEVAHCLEQAHAHEDIVSAINQVAATAFGFFEAKRATIVAGCKKKTLGMNGQALSTAKERESQALLDLSRALKACNFLLKERGFDTLGPDTEDLRRIGDWATKLVFSYIRKRAL